MSIHVKFQLVLACEALSTTFTSKRPLSGVCSNVSVKVRNPRKLGLAKGAGVRSDVVVNLRGEY